MFWGYLVVCIALVAFAGLMSGLTLGLMSLSLVDLEVLIKAGRPDDRKNAAKILPIVKRQHLLLCTLLIGNAMAMEALPIFLDSILPPWAAILISVTLILAFGEIIPQSICSRYGLSVGAKMSPVVRVIVIVLFPVAYPISKLLDLVLGKRHSALLRRAELRTLVDLHGNEAGKGGELTHDETTIITGALDMTQKTAKDAMTPTCQIFSLDINSKLDEKTMELIMSLGHSRVPIYMGVPGNIVGLILVKNLIKCRPEDETPIRDLTIRRIPRVQDHLPLYDILNQFQKGHSHMAVVVKNKQDHPNKPNPENPGSRNYSGNVLRNHNGSGDYLKSVLEFHDKPIGKEDLETISFSDVEVIGIITMEDVIEELLQEEILDETDEYVDVYNRIRINMLPSQRSPGTAPSGSDQFQRRHSPAPSPYQMQSPVLSPYNHVLRSPIPPPFVVRSPLMKPCLYDSPGRSSVPNSPVSKTPYEKLRKPDGL
ncbi:DUF21 domain-containing protein At5g52790 [Linum perenne]